MSTTKKRPLRPVRKSEWRKAYRIYKTAGIVSIIFGILQAVILIYMLAVCSMFEAETIRFLPAIIRIGVGALVMFGANFVTDKAGIIKLNAMIYAEYLIDQQDRYDAFVGNNGVAAR